MHPDRIGLTVAIAMHAIVAIALLSYAPARQALLRAAPIMVDLITPPKVEPPRPSTPHEPPKPRPVAKAPIAPLPTPVLTAPTEAPSPVVAPTPPVPAPAPVVAALPEAVTPPVFHADYLDNPAPAYPPMSRRMHEEGKVILRVLVSPKGGADEVQVRSSSGFARLDDAARDTVRRWKFVPAKRGAEAVSGWVLIPISFRLES
jgi:protein TonB